VLYYCHESNDILRSGMIMSEYMNVSFNVPLEYADKVREAMALAGAGRVGEYTHCSFSVKGTGRFKPSCHANPFIGSVGELECVEEEKVETYCHVKDLEYVVEAIKHAHPYEEMIIDIKPIYEIGRKKSMKS